MSTVHCLSTCPAREQLAAVVFYDTPVLTLDRILHTLSQSGEAGLDSWISSAPGWLSVKLFVERLVREELGVERVVHRQSRESEIVTFQRFGRREAVYGLGALPGPR